MYFDAVIEGDEYKALQQIQCASRAIENRLIQLSGTASYNPRELEDLSSALIYLRLLQDNIGGESENNSWH